MSITVSILLFNCRCPVKRRLFQEVQMTGADGPDASDNIQPRMPGCTSSPARTEGKHNRFEYVRTWLSALTQDPPGFLEIQSPTRGLVEHTSGARVEARNTPLEREIRTNRQHQTPAGGLFQKIGQQSNLMRVSQSAPPAPDRLSKHPLLATCLNSCRLKCSARISTAARQTHRRRFWSADFQAQRTYLLQHVQVQHSQGIHISNRVRQNARLRRFTQVYSLEDEEGTAVRVCKDMFLHTLGLKSDSKLTQLRRALSSSQCATRDGRGGDRRSNSMAREEIIEHISSYHPQVSH